LAKFLITCNVSQDLIEKAVNDNREYTATAIAEIKKKEDERRSVLNAEMEETRKGLREMAAELKRAKESKSAQQAASSSGKTKESKEIKVLQKKLVDLERMIESSDAQKTAEIAEALETASNRQEAFLKEQGRLNAEASREASALDRESRESLAGQISLAMSTVGKQMTDHLAVEGEKRRVHELQIADDQRKTAEAFRAASEAQSQQTNSSLATIHQSLELISTVVNQVYIFFFCNKFFHLLPTAISENQPTRKRRQDR
jgi:hypothetical protein